MSHTPPPALKDSLPPSLYCYYERFLSSFRLPVTQRYLFEVPSSGLCTRPVRPEVPIFAQGPSLRKAFIGPSLGPALTYWTLVIIQDSCISSLNPRRLTQQFFIDKSENCHIQSFTLMHVSY